MNKSQKGFALLESLLILIIVGLVAGTGYYVWHSKQQTENNLNNASSSSQTAPVAKKVTTSTATTGSDIDLIATAIADRCNSDTPSVDKTKLKAVLLKQYTSAQSTLHISGNHAKAGATCDDTGSLGGGGFETLYKKTSGKWEFVFAGQQSPDCQAVDNQGWPSSLLPQCYDSITQSERTPK